MSKKGRLVTGARDCIGTPAYLLCHPEQIHRDVTETATGCIWTISSSTKGTYALIRQVLASLLYFAVSIHAPVRIPTGEHGVDTVHLRQCTRS